MSVDPVLSWCKEDPSLHCVTHSVCLRQQNIKKQILKQLQACLTELWISVLLCSIISPKVSWQTVQESPLAHA